MRLRSRRRCWTRAVGGATTRAELEQKIGLSELHVRPIEKDGVAFIGFEFGTVPSTEDGLGVLTHRGRVVLVGTADVSFVEWMAKKAGGRPSSETELLEV